METGNQLALARSGDAEAFADLVKVLQPQVYRWSLTFARDADEADEISQDTFILMHRRLSQFRGESSLEGWLYHITRRVALARVRKRARRQGLVAAQIPGLEQVYSTDPGARVDRDRMSDYIRTFFTELPARQREVFDLVDLQGHDPSEVAQMIGVKPVTVRANLFKARTAMREKLLALHPSWREINS
jgi:RNA polymerase sigma-70 factor (ECF subfamily)